MNINYEDIETLIPNCTMKKMFIDGIFKTYNIIPNEGYEIHDRDADIHTGEFDEETEEEIILCNYDTNMKSCKASYDFTPHEYEILGELKIVYGERRFCTREIKL